MLYEDKLECTVWDTAGGLCRAEESKFNEVFIHITWALFWKGVMEAVEDWPRKWTNSDMSGQVSSGQVYLLTLLLAGHIYLVL